jgi:hypothetical protein
LTKLLSAQAQLAQLVTKSKQTSGKSSHNNGRSKSKVDQFKVPLPPRGKNSNGKVVKEVCLLLVTNCANCACALSSFVNWVSCSAACKLPELSLFLIMSSPSFSSGDGYSSASDFDSVVGGFLFGFKMD